MNILGTVRFNNSIFETFLSDFDYKDDRRHERINTFQSDSKKDRAGRRNSQLDPANSTWSRFPRIGGTLRTGKNPFRRCPQISTSPDWPLRHLATLYLQILLPNTNKHDMGNPSSGNELCLHVPLALRWIKRRLDIPLRLNLRSSHFLARPSDGATALVKR